MFSRNVGRCLARSSLVQIRRINGSCLSPNPGPGHPVPVALLRRDLTTPPPQLNTSSEWLSESTYDKLADTTMDDLLASLEMLIDTAGDPSHEVEYSSGVLTLKLGQHGTYVINKQPPNKQIWFSSPFSGPKRYDYVQEASPGPSDDWVYKRDGQSMGDLLNEELSKVFGQDIDLGIREITKLADRSSSK